VFYVDGIEQLKLKFYLLAIKTVFYCCRSQMCAL